MSKRDDFIELLEGNSDFSFQLNTVLINALDGYLQRNQINRNEYIQRLIEKDIRHLANYDAARRQIDRRMPQPFTRDSINLDVIKGDD